MSDLNELDPTKTSAETIRARDLIHDWLRMTGMTWTGGCTPFYSPEQWAERGEEYGGGAVLVMCHDGGDLSFLNWDHQLIEKFAEYLKGHGLFVEGMTTWASAVYRIEPLNTYDWAREQQGFNGSASDWANLSTEERQAYEDGAQGIGTV